MLAVITTSLALHPEHARRRTWEGPLISLALIRSSTSALATPPGSTSHFVSLSRLKHHLIPPISSTRASSIHTLFVPAFGGSRGLKWPPVRPLSSSQSAYYPGKHVGLGHQKQKSRAHCYTCRRRYSYSNRNRT